MGDGDCVGSKQRRLVSIAAAHCPSATTPLQIHLDRYTRGPYSKICTLVIARRATSRGSSHRSSHATAGWHRDSRVRRNALGAGDRCGNNLSRQPVLLRKLLNWLRTPRVRNSPGAALAKHAAQRVYPAASETRWS